MTRRPGLSLTEVLVALFIMGIGTIAVLTLFPLGALNMAQAFRDDRTTQAAGQAGAYFRWYWQDRKDQTLPAKRLDAESMYLALDDPGITGGVAVPATETGPSYPVVVDPMGFVARLGGPAEQWVGDAGRGAGQNQSNLGRRSLDVIRTNTTFGPQLALRTCTLLDGLGYDPTSGRAATNGGAIDRDMRYNWLWVIQRPSNSSTTRNTVNVTVVVFDRRAHLYAPPGAETVHTPAPNGAAVGQSRVAFAAGDMPLVQRGSWLMDATVTTFDPANNVYVPPAGGGTPGLRPGVRNANFYRVVSVTDNGTAGIEVELEPPLKPDTMNANESAAARAAVLATHRRFVHLSGAAEVFVLPDPAVAK